MTVMVNQGGICEASANEGGCCSPLEGVQQPVLGCPIAQQERQNRQAGSPGARLDSQHGCHQAASDIECNVRCKQAQSLSAIWQ